MLSGICKIKNYLAPVNNNNHSRVYGSFPSALPAVPHALLETPAVPLNKNANYSFNIGSSHSTQSNFLQLLLD